MAFHTAGRRRQGAARNIVMALPWPQHRLLANYAIAIDHVYASSPIGDSPVASEQLNGLVRFVFNADMIDPEPFASLDPRLFGQEIHRDSYDQALMRDIDRIAPGSGVFAHRGDGDMLEEFFHDLASLAAKSARDNRVLLGVVSQFEI